MTKFLERLKGLLEAFLKKGAFVWNWVQCVAQILMPLRFSIITIFLVALLFLWSPPGKDLLLSLADQEFLLSSDIILFFMTLFFWSMCLWYWSRVMMQFIHDDFFDSRDDREEDKEWKIGLLNGFRKHAPRLMGLLPFIIMFFAFHKAGQVYLGQVSGAVMNNLCYLRWVSMGLGGLYYFIIFIRRRVIFGDKNIERTKKYYAPQHKNWSDLGKASMISLFATLGLSTVIFMMVWSKPQMAILLGTGSVLFLASASWVAFGSTMVSLGKGFKFPIISAALVGAVIIGPYTDNHQVRTLKADTSDEPHLTWDQRPTLEDDFKGWMATRSEIFNKEAEFDPEKIHPIFIIAAEGGGIRAAYWTSNLLAAFQDANPNFAEHVYALSGISGGSLGAALYVNLLKNQENLNCDAHGIVEGNQENRKCAHAVLSEDFLTPTVASMLYPDLIQRLNFLSFIYKFPDRAYALETTFEDAWEMHLDNDRFSRSFLESWDAPTKFGNYTKFRLPSLFLNSTWVEGGKRVITSNIQILKKDFPDAEDLFSVLCSDIPLSTAVHNSARFSYVSPAGTVEEPILDGEPCRQLLAEVAGISDNEKLMEAIKTKAENKDVIRKVWGHVVDGGYFENSGNTTAYDILTSIQGAFKGNEGSEDDVHICGPEENSELQFKCIPVIITLINDPKLVADSRPDANDSAKSHPGHLPQTGGHPDPDRWLTETLSPLKTLFQTRDGRGSYARDSTRKYIELRLGGLALEFSLHDEKGALPLSWVLSDLVKGNIQKQVDEVLVKLGEIKEESGDPLNMEHLVNYRVHFN